MTPSTFLLLSPSGETTEEAASRTLEDDLLASLAAAGHAPPSRVEPGAVGLRLGAGGPADAPPAHLLAVSVPPVWAALLQDPPLPLPTSLFGPAPPPATLQALLEAGLAGWWPRADLDPATLAAALDCDGARWRREARWLERLGALQAQLDERKWVDRAKGALMNAQGLSEAEAFGLLRSASMHANLRLADLARGVVEAAQWADAVNRAGQLRMLSQRLVKLLAQRQAGVDPRGTRAAQAEAGQRVAVNLAHLYAQARSTPEAHWPPALDQVACAWQDLQAALERRLTPALLQQADDRAETLLQAAESLTSALQVDGARRVLHIVNLSGRQRMRVQRVAKQALLQTQGVPCPGAPPLGTLLDEFQAALRELQDAPISTPEIRADLAAAADEWQHLLRSLAQLPQPDGLAGVAQASDALLALFESLTARYEHSLQLIMS